LQPYTGILVGPIPKVSPFCWIVLKIIITNYNNNDEITAEYILTKWDKNGKIYEPYFIKNIRLILPVVVGSKSCPVHNLIV